MRHSEIASDLMRLMYSTHALQCAIACVYLVVILVGAIKMQDLYDIHAPKKATNLSLNSDLLQKARDLKVNLSATLEQALKDKLKNVEAEKWKKENKAAIAAYNEFVAENGCIGDEYRNF